MSDASRNHARTSTPRTAHAQRPAGAPRRCPLCPVGSEIGVPCQPAPAQLKSTPMPHDSLMAAGRDTHRPPSRDRRRRDNDRSTLPDRRATRRVSSRCDLQEISTNLRRGRPETATVHLCILRNAACATPQTPRSSQVVQNQRILVQTRPPPAWGVENKTLPKAPLPQDGFGMSTDWVGVSQGGGKSPPSVQFKLYQ